MMSNSNSAQPIEGSKVWRVPSRTDGPDHIIASYRDDDMLRTTCTCEAGSHKQVCWAQRMILELLASNSIDRELPYDLTLPSSRIEWALRQYTSAATYLVEVFDELNDDISIELYDALNRLVDQVNALPAYEGGQDV